jgi:hypothetical protein
MNNESSRSHAVFTLKLTQTLSTDASEVKRSFRLNDWFICYFRRKV